MVGKRRLISAGLTFLVFMAAVEPVKGQSEMDQIRVAVADGFRTVAGHVQRAAESVPEQHYNYRPTEAVRSFGALVAHIVDGHRYYCGLTRGAPTEWTEAVEMDTLSKTALVQLLRTSIDQCMSALESDNARLAHMIENLGHTSLHYGNLVTYMRQLGMTPPSSS